MKKKRPFGLPLFGSTPPIVKNRLKRRNHPALEQKKRLFPKCPAQDYSEITSNAP